MVEFIRELIKEDEKINRWRFFSILMSILIIVLLLILIKIYKDKIKEINEAYTNGLSNGTQQGYVLGQSQCICNEVTCPICESPNQTVFNLAKEQTQTSNMILYNGTHIVSLPLKSLCEQLQK